MNEHPMQWCWRQARLADNAEVVVSLYFFGEETPGFALYELGVALTIGKQSRHIPLNYTQAAALRMDEGGMYESYSYIADDYVKHLCAKGLKARRQFADFERLLQQKSPTAVAKS